MGVALARVARTAWIPPETTRCVRSSATFQPTWSRWHRAMGTAAPGTSDDDGMVDIDAFLAPYKNYEKTGLPSYKKLGLLTATLEMHKTDPDAYDLTRVYRLLKALGEPHLWEKTELNRDRWGPGFQTIHVAGTKGKGSTVGFLAGILRASGYNTATYKSPHVHSVAERIVVGPLPVDARHDERGIHLDPTTRLATHGKIDAQTAQIVLETQEKEKGKLTYFEILTVLAMVKFRQLGTEIAVVECGVGGEHDATNIFTQESIAAVVITAIGKDHWDALGGTLGHIIRAKCGIVQMHRPTFVAPQTRGDILQRDDVNALLLSEVWSEGGRWITEYDVDVKAFPTGEIEWTEAGAPVQIVDYEIWTDGSDDLWSGKPHAWVKRDIKRVRMSLVGPHQRENAVNALRVMEFIRCGGGQGPEDTDGGVPWDKINDETMRIGLENAVSPGCFETVLPPMKGRAWSDDFAVRGRNARAIDVECAVVADGAHTVESAQAFFETVGEVFPAEPLAVVVAMASDKDLEGFLMECAKAKPEVIVLTTVPVAGAMDRATPTSELKAAWDFIEERILGAEAYAKSTADEQGTPELFTPWSWAPRVSVEDDVSAAIDAAVAGLRQGEKGRGGAVCVTGSLNTVSRAVAWGKARGYALDK